MDLRTLRKRLRYSQAELARIAGVRAATISDIERGVITRPAYDTVIKLATALDQPAPVIAAAIRASHD
jgi:transcriptional regulator with XRE-family HTH domain